MTPFLSLPRLPRRAKGYADFSRVNITEDGRAALLKLSRGDMRRALNVLQVSFNILCAK